MKNKIIEGTEQRYISRKASKYATKLVEDFLNAQKCDYGFYTQYDFRTDLESYVSDNSNDFDSVPDLPNISRALSLVKDKTFLKDGQTFAFLRVGKGYTFIPKETVLNELFELNGIYLKDSVHEMSETTLVFSIAPDSHDHFIEVLNKKFSSKMLWGHFSQGDYLFLMFDKSRSDFKSNIKLFKEFFQRKDNYRNYKMLNLR